MSSGVEGGVEEGKPRNGKDPGILVEVGCRCPVRAGSGEIGPNRAKAGPASEETCYIFGLTSSLDCDGGPCAAPFT